MNDPRSPEFMLRLVLHKLWQLFVLAEPVPDEVIERAGGDVECEHCGLVYFQHPHDLREPWMTLVCGGRRFKL